MRLEKWKGRCIPVSFVSTGRRFLSSCELATLPGLHDSPLTVSDVVFLQAGWGRSCCRLLLECHLGDISNLQQANSLPREMRSPSTKGRTRGSTLIDLGACYHSTYYYRPLGSSRWRYRAVSWPPSSHPACSPSTIVLWYCGMRVKTLPNLRAASSPLLIQRQSRTSRTEMIFAFIYITMPRPYSFPRATAPFLRQPTLCRYQDAF